MEDVGRARSVLTDPMYNCLTSILTSSWYYGQTSLPVQFQCLRMDDGPAMQA